MTGQSPTDDLTLLRKRLHLLLNEKVAVDNGRRVLPIDASAGPLETLKSEILETQLPRTLTFENDRGEILALEVSGGRVLRGGKATTPDLVAAHAVMNGFLSARRQDDHAAILRVICAFAARAVRLTVDFEYLEDEPSAVSHGIDIGTLVDETTVQEPETKGSIPDFFAQCQPFADAGVLWIGDCQEHVFGPEAVAGLLVELSEKERASAAALEDAAEDSVRPAHFVVYAGEPEAGAAVLCATEGDALGLLRFQQSQLGAILAEWPDLKT